MRIGQINKENYTQFVKMINPSAKNVKAPTLESPDASKGVKDHSVNPFEDPNRNITGRTDWQKIIPISDEVTDKLLTHAKKCFVKNYGMSGEGDEFNIIVNNYLNSLLSSERSSAGFTISETFTGEAERLAAIVRKHNPGWEFG